jgi:hypothetical protein
MRLALVVGMVAGIGLLAAGKGTKGRASADAGVGATGRDAGVPTATGPDASAPSEDEQIVKELELLENLEVLQKLEQLDVGD